MTEKNLKNNQAVVAGEIISDFEFSHEVFGEGFYFVKLKVSRLSHSRKRNLTTLPKDRVPTG